MRFKFLFNLIHLANQQGLFLTGQPWCVLRSWYTGGYPNQGFWWCFAHEWIMRCFIPSVAQANKSTAKEVSFEWSNNMVKPFTLLNDEKVRSWNHITSLINSGMEMINPDMYEYNMVVFTMFFGQIMPVMSSYDSESELELSTWIDAFFDFFFIDSRKSFTNTLGGTMSSERKAISELLHQLEGKDQGFDDKEGWLWDLTHPSWTKGYTSKIMHTENSDVTAFKNKNMDLLKAYLVGQNVLIPYPSTSFPPFIKLIPIYIAFNRWKSTPVLCYRILTM